MNDEFNQKNDMYEDFFSISSNYKRYPVVKNEYLTIEQSLRVLNVSKQVLLEQIARGLLTPCFLYDGKLLSSKFLEDDDQKIYGYFNYRGYITPNSDVTIISYLQSDQQEFAITNVRTVELLAEVSKTPRHLGYYFYIVNGKHEPAIDTPIYLNQRFFNDCIHEICDEDIIPIKAIFKTSDCMLIKNELEIVFNTDGSQSSLAIEKNDISIVDEELIGEGFQRAILETLQILKYNPQALPFKKNSSKEGIRKKVKDAILENPNYNLLVKKSKNAEAAIYHNWSVLKREKVLKDENV